jgi:hypothetical protein
MAETVPLQTLCRLLGLGPRRIQLLVGEGAIPKPVERGQYDWIAAVRGYIAFLRDRAPPSDRARLILARAQLLEHRLAECQAELVEVATVDAAVARLKARLAATFAAMPARYAAVACPEHPERGRWALARLAAEVLAELDAFELRFGDEPATGEVSETTMDDAAA